MIHQTPPRGYLVLRVQKPDDSGDIMPGYGLIGLFSNSRNLILVGIIGGACRVNGYRPEKGQREATKNNSDRFHIDLRFCGAAAGGHDT